MRIGEPGAERPALLNEDGRLLDLSGMGRDIDSAFIAGGGVDEVRRFASGANLRVVGELSADGNLTVTDGARVGAPVAKPEKIICIGLNYSDHAEETGQAVPAEPIVFMKAPNCLVGPRDEILIPRLSRKTDWEIELAVVVGARARYLNSPDDAGSVIFGYAISNDLSEREFQLERGGQWDKGKCCETFNPMGPWVATPDEIVDVQALRLKLSVNGVTRQNGTTKNMIFGVNHIVWYLSQFLVLEPGDIINTGTPAGVSLGHDNVPFLAVGDLVELEADGLGRQASLVGQA
jgi:2-keto-4-pentenoate hydratase/2-oxohepta-3-ene-1,7-dioic acid hydratase in catechol pathway